MPSLFFRALVLATLAIPLWAQEPVGEKAQADDPRARQQYLEQLHSGGDPRLLPPGARLRALEEQNEMIRREGERYWQAAGREGGVAGQLATSSQWLFIGPQPTSAGSSASSGRTTAMVVDPHDGTGDTAYIGGAQGGVWKTTNGGTTWTPLSDFEASLAVGSMAIDGSTNPATVYVGTGEQSFSADSYYGAGILKSVDGGTTWTQLGANPFAGAVAGCVTSGTSCGGAFIGGLSIRPGTPSTLLAAVRLFGGNGIYRSTDSGVNWTRATGTTAVANAVQYATSDIAYAGISGGGVWKSTDGGATWNATNGTGANVITTASTGRVELAVALSDANGNTVYASVADSVSANGLSGFYKTIDGGLNWTKLGPNFDGTTNPTGLRNYCSPQCWYDNIVAVHPTNANVVFVGGSAVAGFISKSVNGGTSWTTATGTGGIHVDEHAAAFSPTGNVLYWGNDGGVWKTTDTDAGNPTATWTNLNHTLGLTQFYTYFALHPSNINITLGGTQDNGTQKYDGTQILSGSWLRVTCGDGASAVIDAFNPNLTYANCQRIDIRKSVNGGTSGFTLKETGIVASDDTRTQFIPPMIGDGNPHGQNNVYFGTFRVYQSKTAIESWSIISNDLTGGVSSITNMAIAPSDRGVLYVGTNNGKVARGAGLTTLDCAALLTCFTDVTGTGLPERRISAIGVSETNANLVYVTIAGFGAGESQGNSNHVFRSTTGGTNWTNITSDLPNISVNDIVVDPDILGTLYVGTDVGVFRSTNDGVSWSTLANGLPRVAVFGLKLHRPTRTLRAATHGRGFWDLSVPTTASPQLTLTPGAVVFGDQLQNTTSASRTVTITALNNDVTGLNVSAATGDFSRTNDCGTTVTANSTCTIGITFTPTGGGTRNGAITLTSAGLGSPQTLNLTGMSGEVFLAQPDTLTFKAVIGWTASTQAVIFTNISGASITVSNVTVSGDYTRTHDCTTVANGANCTITIGFLPAAGGARNGTLTITHTGTGSPKTVTLSGTGVEFTLSLARPQRPSRTGSGSVAVPQGQTATIDLVLGASASTDDFVDLQCVGAPRNSTCKVMPARLPLRSDEQAVRVTITTTAPRASRLSRASGTTVSASASGTPLGVHRVQIRARIGQATRDLPLEIQVVPRTNSIRSR